MTRQQKSKPSISLTPGDYVLLGSTRASFPSHWVLGTVLWADQYDLVVRRSNQNGGTWIETAHVSEVRAEGSLEHLGLVKGAARKAVLELQRVVNDCEAALGLARDAVFKKLEELAAGGLQVLPPDFQEIDADREGVRAACEQYDMETDP
jgi:hypothetical protein